MVLLKDTEPKGLQGLRFVRPFGSCAVLAIFCSFCAILVLLYTVQCGLVSSIELVLSATKIYSLNDLLLVELYLTANMSPFLKATKLIFNTK